jgi:hypothetical protein
MSTFSLDECIGNRDDATHCTCFTDHGDECCYCDEAAPPAEDEGDL